MPHRIALTAVLLTLTSLVSPAASEVETLRARCAEQERQIRELEEENSKLRQMSGVNSKFASRPTPAAEAQPPGSAAATPAPSADTATPSTKYTVRKGDSWERVARKFGTRTDKLAALNGAKSTDMLREGQVLKVPSATTSAASASATPAASGPPTTPPGSGIYQVKQGETYYSIGKKLGISPEKLQAANPSIKATSLRPGLTIKTDQTIVSGERPAAIAPPPTTGTASLSQPPPAPPPLPTRNPAPADQPLRSSPKPVMINDTITVGQFAADHGTTVARLNSLNNLDLVESTVLAVGSELYVPAQP